MEPIPYIINIALATGAGGALVLSFWAYSISRWELRHGTYRAHCFHIGIMRIAMLLFLLFLGSALAIPARCQVPTLPPVPTDHRLGRWHDLPPPMNIVNGGFLLEHAATTRRDATYVALAGLAAGAVLATQNQAVGIALGTAAVGYSIRLNLRSAKSQRKAGQLFQIGYNALYLYDVVPDSIDAHPHLRIIPK